MDKHVLGRLLKVSVVLFSFLCAVVGIILDVSGYSLLALYFCVPICVVGFVGTLWMGKVLVIPVFYMIYVDISELIVDYIKNGWSDE